MKYGPFLAGIYEWMQKLSLLFTIHNNFSREETHTSGRIYLTGEQDSESWRG